MLNTWKQEHAWLPMELAHWYFIYGVTEAKSGLKKSEVRKKSGYNNCPDSANCSKADCPAFTSTSANARGAKANCERNPVVSEEQHSAVAESVRPSERNKSVQL